MKSLAFGTCLQALSPPQRPGGRAEGTFVPISIWILLLKSFCHLSTVTENSDKKKIQYRKIGEKALSYVNREM